MKWCDEGKVWFPAKRYGFGWGLPNCWQGWIVLVIYVALLGAGAFLFLPGWPPGRFIACVVGLTILLTIVCLIKSEKPRWRWGKK